MFGIVYGQDRPVLSAKKAVQDTISSVLDTIPMVDTSKTTTTTPTTVKISPDSPADEVNYDAVDSMNYDIKNKKVFLYGNAIVTQKTLKLTAERMIIDFGNNIVIAEGHTDSLGNRKGNPVFEDGDQNFSCKKMKYNFKTKKGIVYDAVTQEGDLFIHGAQSKIFQGVQLAPQDSATHEVIYNRDAIFTTCNHPDPHFGIRAKKLKMIPNKIAIVGPSMIELGGVPTPLVLPFGFFPLKQGARTGLIFPRDYEYSPTWGFGFKNVGWYFPINDHWDTKVLTDIYFKGTWGISAQTRYKYRYRNSGNFNLSFSDRVRELSDASRARERSLSIQWSHQQDASAHPNRSFSSSVNIQTNGFQSRNYNDASSVLQNTLHSNVNYSQRFPGSPFNLTASMSHSQNTRTHEVTFNLPTVGLRMNRIYPFKKKNRVGNEKWYEKVTFKYDMDAQNRLTTTDTTMFTKETLESAQYGMRHKISSDVNFKLFKYINISPNVQYSDIWYGNRIEKIFDNELVIDTTVITNPNGTIFGEKYDTTSYGSLENIKQNGFSRYFQFNAGVNLSTTRYFTKLFKKGFIRGIRHVAKPRVGFSYTPDYTAPKYGYYRDAITPQTPLNDNADTMRYSVFSEGIYGAPSSGGKQLALTYGIRNNFEAKYWSAKDSTAKKFKLFNDIDVRGSYNLAKDSLRWSDVTASGSTRFFKGLTNVTLNARWSPYALNDRRAVVNTFYWDEKKKPLRFVNVRMNTSTNFSIKQLRGFFIGKNTSANTSSGGRNNNTSTNSSRGGNASSKSSKPQGLLDIFDKFRISYNFNLTFEPSRKTGRDSLIITSHSIETRGNIDLTENWKVTVGRIGYNFKDKKVTYPDFSFYRDLHCWEMGMSWQPERTTYSFFLRVKPSSLDFIELPYKKNNADGRFGGF